MKEKKSIILKPGESMHNYKKLNKLSKEDLFKLNKKEQTKILKNLGASEIPKLESDRVDFILKLHSK